ncbi:MAG: DNA mismatch repair protein MutS, partial [Deinococcota bacterium]|nr:DNA mismatch repair protein MutS [Deinococcota bacterium]
LLSPELYDHEPSRESFSRRFPVMLSRGRFGLETAQRVLREQFGAEPLDLGGALCAASGAVLGYALETQQGRLPQVTRFLRYDPGAYMQLDEVAFTTLEVFHSAMGPYTLFGAIDSTRTAPGRRLLKAWLRHPLLDLSLIEARQSAVDAFVKDSVLRGEIRKTLYKMHDLERLSSRLASGRAGARDLAALARSLALVPHLRDLLAARPEGAMQSLVERMQDLQEVGQLIRAALVADPPLKLSEGRLIQDGFDQGLDRLRLSAEQGRGWIAILEQEERKRTRIPGLKVGFNNVFGYYLEITRAHYPLVPEDYRPVQTLKDRQRFTRPDLRDKEREILRSEEAANKREIAVFNELRETLIPYAQAVSELSTGLAELDVYAGLAEVAAAWGYSRPRLSQEGELSIRQGRHAVVEQHHLFIPNDLSLATEKLLILTGPNMSGKSTYLRQTALIALLAQIGSFVPAEKAELPLFERIYTRIGAADDIAGGRSTFMVEMEELARILQGATPRSLVLLDEVGRGTSTYDGLALAWAASEYLHDRVEAYTLFATHYFELTGLAAKLPAARNHHVAAKEEAGGLVFYHQVLPGPASKAYGLEVARLAGVPAGALERARALLSCLEAKGEGVAAELLSEVLALDLSRLSPLDALTLLHRLQERARGLALIKD